MEKIIGYLSSKGKLEIAIAMIFFIFFPVYLIEFLYFPYWFKETDIIKITVVNIGLLSAFYTLQLIIFLITNFLFTKKGRTIEQILYTPALVLGMVILLEIYLKIFFENIVFNILPDLGLSFVIQVIIAIIYERSLKLVQEE